MSDYICPICKKNNEERGGFSPMLFERGANGESVPVACFECHAQQERNEKEWSDIRERLK